MEEEGLAVGTWSHREVCSLAEADKPLAILKKQHASLQNHGQDESG
jgi:hypothetical protein